MQPANLPAPPRAERLPPPPSHNLIAAALAISLLLHASLMLTGGTPAGSLGVAGRADEHAPRRTWLSARLAPPAPKALPRPERIMPTAPPEPAAPEEVPAPPEPPPMASAPAGEAGFGLLPTEIPQPEESTYFKPAELDTRAVPIAPIDPRPEVSARVPVIIRLEIFISATGTVDKVEVRSVSVEGYPTDFAVRAFKDARFDPAKIAGAAVPSRKTIELSYEPN